MMQPEMLRETVEILKTAIEKGELVNLIINNRAGECAFECTGDCEEIFGEDGARREPATGSALTTRVFQYGHFDHIKMINRFIYCFFLMHKIDSD